MGDVPLIDADTFLQCGRPANIPEAALRERLLLAENGPIVRSRPATRRNTSTIRPWGAKARRENQIYQQVELRHRLAFVIVSGVFPPKLPGV